jgi:hypothetical protein
MLKDCVEMEELLTLLCDSVAGLSPRAAQPAEHRLAEHAASA